MSEYFDWLNSQETSEEQCAREYPREYAAYSEDRAARRAAGKIRTQGAPARIGKVPEEKK